MNQLPLRVLFAGTPGFAAAHLQGLIENQINIIGVIAQPDKPGKRGKKPIACEVKKLALSHDIPVLQPDKIGTEDIKDLNADLMIVVAYGQILRQAVLDTPRLGCINVHASLLPRWRGAAPIQRAILAGDKQTGVCIMQMDKGLDTGDVLSRSSVDINLSDSSADLADKLIAIGIPALVEVIHQLAEGRAKPIKQTETGMTYAKKITKQEAQCFWQDSSVEIARAIAGFNPEPICYTYLKTNKGELRVKLYQASVVEEVEGNSDQQKQPGQILGVSKKGVLVACGNGRILIQRLQLPVGKGSILNGADILNARADLIHDQTQFLFID